VVLACAARMDSGARSAILLRRELCSEMARAVVSSGGKGPLRVFIATLTAVPPSVRRHYERAERHAEDGSSPMKSEIFSKRAHRFAQVGICVQFLALVRTLAEFFRLEHVQGPALHITTVAPYVGAALLAALLTWTGVLCYFAGRDRAAVGVAGMTVLALLAVKIAVIGL
jgi:hypothetical protein